MSTKEELKRAKWLDRHLDAPNQGVAAGDTPAPDPELAELATFARTVATLGGAELNATAESNARSRVWARVRAQVQANAATASPRLPWWRSLVPSVQPAWAKFAFATVATVVVIVAGAVLWMSRPQPVDAQAVVRKAQAVMASVPADLHSFAMTQVITDVEQLGPRADVEGQARAVNMIWYQAPNLWHGEGDGAVYGPDGKPVAGQSWQYVTVSDGKNVWSYDPLRVEVIVNKLNADTPFSSTSFLFGTSATSLEAFLQPDTACPDARINPQPRYLGSQVVAGRAAYVIDLGRLECPFAPGMNGRRVIWVDQETYYVLRSELRRLSDDRVVAVTEVSSIQYNIELGAALFRFTPPTGAKVLDLRDRPGPATPTPVPASTSTSTTPSPSVH